MRTVAAFCGVCQVPLYVKLSDEIGDWAGDVARAKLPDEFLVDYVRVYDVVDAEVKRNLARLVELGQLRPAMRLSLELMEKGSYQVEMSDEGLMTDDVEDCLNVVIRALKKCDLPASRVIGWCNEMLAKDRVEFICDRELKMLRDEREASR